MDAEMMAYPNTLLMCCPTGDGAAAVVLVSDEKLRTLVPRAAAAGGEDLGVGDDAPTRGPRPARCSPTSTR